MSNSYRFVLLNLVNEINKELGLRESLTEKVSINRTP